MTVTMQVHRCGACAGPLKDNVCCYCGSANTPTGEVVEPIRQHKTLHDAAISAAAELPRVAGVEIVTPEDRQKVTARPAPDHKGQALGDGSSAFGALLVMLMLFLSVAFIIVRVISAASEDSYDPHVLLENDRIYSPSDDLLEWRRQENEGWVRHWTHKAPEVHEQGRKPAMVGTKIHPAQATLPEGYQRCEVRRAKLSPNGAATMTTITIPCRK